MKAKETPSLLKPTGSRAAIILAGGDGMRLRPLTRFISGKDIPKQFCILDGKRTLLEETRERVRRNIAIENTLVVVNREHEPFYESLLDDLPASNLVVQPSNRGTAVGIMYGLARLCRRSPESAVTIFPSDHFVADDEPFMRHIEASMAAVEARPELTVILGIEPNCAETSYGWIEPAEQLDDTAQAPLLRVARFWEKPCRALAEKLWTRGCLWNSFVITARADVLMAMLARHMPTHHAVLSELAALSGEFEDVAAELAYRDMECVGFSEEILSRVPRNLVVRPVADVGWSDLGEPRRVIEMLTAVGRKPAWAKLAREQQMPWACDQSMITPE